MLKQENYNLGYSLKVKNIILITMMVLIDYLAVIIAEAAALFTRYQSFTNIDDMYLGQLEAWVLMPLVFLTFFKAKGLYSQGIEFWQEVQKIFSCCNYAMLSIILMMYAIKVSAASSRLFVVFLWGYSFILVCAVRYILKKLAEKSAFLRRPVLLVGTGASFLELIDIIKNNKSLGYNLAGILTDSKTEEVIMDKTAVLGRIEDIKAVIEYGDVQTVMVVIEGKPWEWVNKYISSVQLLVENVIYVPNVGSLPLGNLKTHSVLNEKLTFLSVKNNLASFNNILLKTAFDYVFAGIALLLFSPLFLVLYYKIKKDSSGPVVYDGIRIGKNGKTFKCYKFRSMYVNSERILADYLEKNADKRIEWNKYHKLANDPRITPFGEFIRNTSLDELPQLWNVFCGEMSLVGPRPYLEEEKAEMGEAYNTIILTKPGMTGYWQVNGRSEVDFKTRLEMDCWYIYHWQIWMDIALLWKTAWVVLNRRGAK